MGNNQDGFLVTLVERSSRLLIAVKTKTRNACEVAQAILDALLDITVSWVKTITFDNGSEFAKHDEIAKALGVNIYFADPYASYQWGTNEHVNGLIRRHLPERAPFKSLSRHGLDIIIELINNTPRICLGDRTPNEVFQTTAPKPPCITQILIPQRGRQGDKFVSLASHSVYFKGIVIARNGAEFTWTAKAGNQLTNARGSQHRRCYTLNPS